MVLEVLIPTANFRESRWKWELWKESSDATLSRVPYSAEERIVLKAGETYRYPKLVVRPLCSFESQQFDGADPNTFVLRWSKVESGNGEGVHQELELGLAIPGGMLREAEDLRTIRSAVVEVYGNEWPLGTHGVGDLRLIPGNFYTVQLTVRDATGSPLARYGRLAVQVPWSHRHSNPPHHGMPQDEDSWRSRLPLEGSMWDQGTYGSADGRVETLRERVGHYFRDRQDDFEHEYVAVVKAWLDWRDGYAAGARDQLARIAAPLPEGNVARETALRLIHAIDAGEASPRPLRFGDAQAQVER